MSAGQVRSYHCAQRHGARTLPAMSASARWIVAGAALFAVALIRLATRAARSPHPRAAVTETATPDAASDAPPAVGARAP